MDSRAFRADWPIHAFVLSLILLGGQFAQGQSGLRESLERLDTDQDGRIDPEEITPLARPYLERIAKPRRLSLERSNRIETWQEAARVYHALQNGVSGERIRPDLSTSVKEFGPDPDQPLIPDFGLPIVKYDYLQEDVEEADRTLRRYDRDRDGYINREEASRSMWTHRNPFEMDLDRDGRLSRMELTQRYARRRLLSGASDELVQRARRVGNGIRPTEENEDEREDSSWWRRGGSRYYLTASVLGRFDTNRNGRLEANEAKDLGVPPSRIDVDRDGELSREELNAFLGEKQDEAGDQSEGLPGWFFELDGDRDGQVEMSEFTTEWTAAKLQEFSQLDSNEDGLLTASEVANSKAMMGGSFSNEKAEVIPPRKTIISEIEIVDDFTIGDLNVYLSITHSHTSYLDGYLTGPDGQRVELFTDVGGSGDHFDQTIFDDQSGYPITKARSPFKGTFMPEANQKRQPSLSHFTNKSAQGVWQLVIRATRSERFGMLHSWGLIIRPKDDMLDEVAVASEQDGPRPDVPVVGQPSASNWEREAEERSRKEADKTASFKKTYSKADYAGRSDDEIRRMKEESRANQISQYRQWLESKETLSPQESQKLDAIKAMQQKSEKGSKEDWSRGKKDGSSKEGYKRK